MKAKAHNIIIDEDYDKCSYKAKIMAHRDMLFDQRLSDRDKIVYLMLLFAATNIEKTIQRRDIAYAKGYSLQTEQVSYSLANLQRYGYIDYDRYSYKIITIKDSGRNARDIFKIKRREKTKRVDKKKV